MVRFLRIQMCTFPLIRMSDSEAMEQVHTSLIRHPTACQKARRVSSKHKADSGSFYRLDEGSTLEVNTISALHLLPLP